MSDMKITRRDFVKLTVAGATLLVGSQIFRRAQATETVESNGRQYAMVIQMYWLRLLYISLPGT
jgi:hypothetical protein